VQVGLMTADVLQHEDLFWASRRARRAVRLRHPVRAAYGQNYERLAWVKRKYHPDNLFKVNHNIMPAVLASR
jgi:hypothetical protein